MNGSRSRPTRVHVLSVAAQLAIALASAVPSLLHAQASPGMSRLDAGSFTLFVAGGRTGQEQFSMQSVEGADGTVLELRAESSMGERRGVVRLSTDSAGSPLAYAVEERTGSVVSLRLSGQRVRGRFATLARSTRGEAAREYLLAPGAIVLEDEGVHQYAMLLRPHRPAVGDTLLIPTLTPVGSRQGVMRLVLESTRDTVTVAGTAQEAWRWNATPTPGDQRTIWADPTGRVLRLRIPAQRLEAIRDDVPR
ncbi:MAG TPA: hypothetical protein VE869_03830 [Gemmatimonas sp.]|nr:hypothetical protein [Gemmatimonas sp.]